MRLFHGARKHPNVIVMQVEAAVPVWGSKATRSFRNARICRICWGIIKTASLALPSFGTWVLAAGCVPVRTASAMDSCTRAS
jgi:hypothetical protein